MGWKELLSGLGLAAAAATVLGRLGGLMWPFDLLSHWVLPLAVLCTLGLVVSVLRRRLFASLALLATTTTNVAFLSETMVPVRDPKPASSLRIVTHNVHTGSRAFDSTVSWLSSVDADVVCLPEIDLTWLDALRKVRGMRILKAVPRQDNFGIAVLLSDRIEIHRSEVVSTRVPMVEAMLVSGNTVFELLAVHALPPVGGVATSRRDAHLQWVGGWVRDREGLAVVCGDLNATRWSSGLRGVMRQSGLRDARRGFGWLGTWPTGWLVPSRIPIDHVLLTEGWWVADAYLVEDVGSDHLPLVVELGPSRR